MSSFFNKSTRESTDDRNTTDTVIQRMNKNLLGLPHFHVLFSVLVKLHSCLFIFLMS